MYIYSSYININKLRKPPLFTTMNKKSEGKNRELLTLLAGE